MSSRLPGLTSHANFFSLQYHLLMPCVASLCSILINTSSPRFLLDKFHIFVSGMWKDIHKQKYITLAPAHLTCASFIHEVVNLRLPGLNGPNLRRSISTFPNNALLLSHHPHRRLVVPQLHVRKSSENLSITGPGALSVFSRHNNV